MKYEGEIACTLERPGPFMAKTINVLTESACECNRMTLKVGMLV